MKTTQHNTVDCSYTSFGRSLVIMNTPINVRIFYFLAVQFLSLALISSGFLPYIIADRQCATLTFNYPMLHNWLTLRELTVIGNSADEYVFQKNVFSTPGVWWVAPGCKLKLCNYAFLNGQCQNWTGNTKTNHQPWLSAKCECAKTCRCANVIFRKSVCARVYHHAGGCYNCRSTYTELESGSFDTFTDEWNGKVDSILVRPGCKLTIFEEEDFNGDSILLEGSNQLHKLNATPGSYECECTFIEPAKLKAALADPSAPILIDIPQSIDDIAGKLVSYPNHPGLLAALRSIRADRSSRNSYILLLGSTGAGKSSTINVLLGKPNVTIAGDFESATSEITELRIPVPLPKYGMNNSQLRIIDTPGLGDTRGIEQDARFLATLDDFLSNHEELKIRKPNLVLVFHKFTDNRRDGVSSQFTKMIRGLNNLKGRITDEKFSNVAFVFSHFCSASPRDQRDPSRLLQEFRNIIKTYSLFPSPIFTVVVENKGKDNLLPMEMGNFLMPNQEYFPKNLIQKFDMITSNLNDAVGNEIIRAAFMSQEGLRKELLVEATKHYEMVPLDHHNVPFHLKLLSLNANSFCSTEVTKLLEEAYKSDPCNSLNREQLEYLQIYLNLRNIRSKEDVPRTSLAIIELLKDLPLDNDNYYRLLNIALNIDAPTIPGNLIVGHGYYNPKTVILPSTPFDMEELAISNAGFMIPKVITSERRNDVIVQKEVICEDTFSGCVHKSTLTFQLFRFRVKAGSLPTNEFLYKIQSISPFDQHDFENVEMWNQFLNEFGTHIVTTAAIGGRIEIRFKKPNATRNDAQVIKFQQEVVEFIIGQNLALQQKQNEDLGITVSFVFRGGNPAYHLMDLANLSLEQFSITIKNWKKSLHLYPAAFLGEVLPLPAYFGKMWSTQTHKKTVEALQHLQNSTLSFVPPTIDPKVIEEIKRKGMEQEEEIERVKKLLEERKEEDEKRIRKAEEDMTRRREEAKWKDLERKRQLDEAEAIYRRELERRKITGSYAAFVLKYMRGN